ncbi:PGPGW domain-containing protein [Streptomyces sp. G-G2]|uniref:PGPGW domain-containing protein n=1 Tax=Streptomyces sp. G-G2 TaxID=3046201 RepID=UPI0024B8F4FD|nr:PGPGW domain-containing protein [Streptomyces sp. G-G2]MDJ0382129.1 PGPGW domain-containing protein [Streptomyces sp. G-G2]
MAGGDASPLAPVIVIAALVIRTAITELRRPGSARSQWTFATNPRAMAAGATAAAATILIGGTRFGWAAAAWALLAGALTAFLTGRDSQAASSRPSKEQPVSERQVGRVMAAIGAPLTLAGVAMYFLPGPGFPVLIIGLALLITGLVMTASARRYVPFPAVGQRGSITPAGKVRGLCECLREFP